LSASLLASLVTAVVVGLDQGTKALIRANVDRGSSDSVFPGVDIVHVHNKGVAFGMFSGGGAILIVITCVAVAALLIFFATHARRPYVWLPTGLLLGGAAGNLIDRARQGHVTDFIDLPLWPAFNVADIAITFGVLSLLYVLEGPPKSHEEADAYSPA
jgi:signal peptidase II